LILATIHKQKIVPEDEQIQQTYHCAKSHRDYSESIKLLQHWTWTNQKQSP